MTVIEFLILTLATWRFTALVVLEDGPWGIFVRFRGWAGVEIDINGVQVGTNAVSELLACVWCLSIWTGIVFFVAWWFRPKAVVILSLPLAFSAGAIVIQEFLNGQRN